MRGATDGFVIMARTDAFAHEGRSAALDRAAAYVAAGADMIFAEALYTLEDYAAFTRRDRCPRAREPHGVRLDAVLHRSPS